MYKNHKLNMAVSMLIIIFLMVSSLGSVFAAEDPPVNLVITGVKWSPEKPKEGEVLTFSVLVKNQGTQATTGTLAPALVRDWNQVIGWAIKYTQPIQPGETATIPINGGNGLWVAEVAGRHDLYADLTYNGVKSPRWYGSIEISGTLTPPPEYNPPERPVGYKQLDEWPNAENTGCNHATISGNLYGPSRDTDILFPDNGHEGSAYDPAPFPTYRLGYDRYIITEDNAVIENKNIYGGVIVRANNVTIRNCYIEASDGYHAGAHVSSKSVIMIESGKSATIENCEINGLEGTHAGIWNQGVSMTAVCNNIYNTNDGIFHWKSGYSPSDGNCFRIEDNYIHDLTHDTANGHVDGFQTLGASNGLILHNYFDLNRSDNACIAIWNNQGNSANIMVKDNLLNGGGFTIYSHDKDDLYTVTNTWFIDNAFSLKDSSIVGNFGVWYPVGPTDGWNAADSGKSCRSGNYVVETGQNIDNCQPASS